MIKAIVFDFDGVLVDSERPHFQAFLECAQPYGVEFDYAYYCKHVIGFDDRDGFRMLLASKDDLTNPRSPHDYAGDAKVIEVLKAQKAQVFQRIMDKGVVMIPGSRPFVERMAGQLPTAIASGATRRDIDFMLARMNLSARFEPIVTADDVARSKPDPESYAKAASLLARLHPRLNITPSDCLAIEDTAAGIASARGAGLWTLGLASAGAPELLHGAHRVVASLENLSLEQLNTWFG